MFAGFDQIMVSQRIHKKHPEIEDEDVITAWRNAVAIRNRTYSPPDYYAAAGADSKGRMLEMLGVELEDGTVNIFHAMKLQDGTRKELGTVWE